MELTKICESCHITETEAKEIVFTHHELEKLIPKKRLKIIKNIELDEETSAWINKLAKSLKVSSDAVIGWIIKNYLKNHS